MMGGNGEHLRSSEKGVKWGSGGREIRNNRSREMTGAGMKL